MYKMNERTALVALVLVALAILAGCVSSSTHDAVVGERDSAKKSLATANERLAGIVAVDTAALAQELKEAKDAKAEAERKLVAATAAAPPGGDTGEVSLKALDALKTSQKTAKDAVIVRQGAVIKLLDGERKNWDTEKEKLAKVKVDDTMPDAEYTSHLSEVARVNALLARRVPLIKRLSEELAQLKLPDDKAKLAATAGNEARKALGVPEAADAAKKRVDDLVALETGLPAQLDTAKKEAAMAERLRLGLPDTEAPAKAEIDRLRAIETGLAAKLTEAEAKGAKAALSAAGLPDDATAAKERVDALVAIEKGLAAQLDTARKQGATALWDEVKDIRVVLTKRPLMAPAVQALLPPPPPS